MQRIILMALAFMALVPSVHATDSTTTTRKKKGWYFTWGYTRAWYSRSTIHFKDLSGRVDPNTGQTFNYNFVVHDVKATDRPDFDKLKDVINITIPQFVFRIGHEINEKWDIELNYDHTKYIVDDFQTAFVTGQINHQYLGQNMVLNPYKFLHFEHSDGANFWMLNAVRKFKIFHPNKNFRMTWVVKPGAGIVFPRTDVTMFGTRLNNDWHLAGWIMGVESGLRMEALNHIFFEFVGKGSYADYVKCLVLGKGNGTASHSFFTAQLTMTLGYRIDSWKKSN